MSREKQDMPRWEFALLARKDPLAEGIKWLEEHGFHPLSIRVKSERNNDTWERVFQKDDHRVLIHVSLGKDMWVAVLYADKVCRGEGPSPFKALDDLFGKVPLEEILDRII